MISPDVARRHQQRAHHIGADTRESARAAAPPGTAALRHAPVALPDAAERSDVLDLADAG
jgi:hypothetical protein